DAMLGANEQATNLKIASVKLNGAVIQDTNGINADFSAAIRWQKHLAVAPPGLTRHEHRNPHAECETTTRASAAPKRSGPSYAKRSLRGLQAHPTSHSYSHVPCKRLCSGRWAPGSAALNGHQSP